MPGRDDAAEAFARAQEPEPAALHLDILDVLDAMSGHYHEHRRELLRWPWKLFGAQWGRMLIAAAKEAERQRVAKREHTLTELRGAHAGR